MHRKQLGVDTSPPMHPGVEVRWAKLQKTWVKENAGLNGLYFLCGGEGQVAVPGESGGGGYLEEKGA